MRLFFALWPPRAVARALAQWAEEARKESGGRLTAEEKIHLTLAFLGEGAAERAGAAAESVRASPFELPVDTAKYWKHNKILWVGPRTVPAGLSALVAPLHDRLKASGFALEERPFAAHITLIRKAAVPRVIPPPPKVLWPADEFVLAESKAGRYEVLRRFALG